MPKRKHNKDYEYISDQIKKLKKKLKRARKQRESSSSASESENNNEDCQIEDTISITEHEVNKDIGVTHLQSPIHLEIPSNQTLDQTLDQPLETTLVQTLEPTPGPILEPTLGQTLNEAITAEYEEPALDKDLLEILGDDPTCAVSYGPDIHKELASRLQHVATSGLTKETRTELQQRYLLPANAILLGAPAMNPEIKAALPETLANRDKAIETKQKLLASAISCVASVTSQILGSQNKNTDLLKKLMDANKLLCDLQHSDSITRRMFSTSVLKKDVKTQVINTKIDKFLFSENLPDTLRTAKTVSKSSAEIKNNANRNKQPQPSTFKASNLNSKAPAAPTRKPPPATTQKTRPLPTRQSQPARSSKTSWKTSRYHR